MVINMSRSVLIALFLVCLSMQRVVRGGFDIRRRLASKTRYAFRLPIPDAPSAYQLADPHGYAPLHLWLLSRHGSRWPTGDRMNQIKSLSKLFKDANNTADHPWMIDWSAPFHVGLEGGELHPLGEDELLGLAYRMRKRYPQLARTPYYPRRFPLVSTQVARAAASASSFAYGFFPEVQARTEVPAGINVLPKHTEATSSRQRQDEGQQHDHERSLAAHAKPDASLLQGTGPDPMLAAAAAAADSDTHAMHARDQAGAGRGSIAETQEEEEEEDGLHASLHEHPPLLRRAQPVAITMAPKTRDPLLRFFEMCPAYAQHDEYTENWMSGWAGARRSLLLPGLERRLGLSRPMQQCEVEALWQLCTLEAGILGMRDRACSLLKPKEVSLLEWLEDVRLMETQSYGASINYAIAAPLLADALSSLQRAAASPTNSDASAAGTLELAAESPLARLLFAHCETLIPLMTLMGLFEPEGLHEHEDALHEDPDVVQGAVSLDQAQADMLRVDTLDDLPMLLGTLRALNSEDDHACFSSPEGASSTSSSGRAPDVLPVPDGWSPLIPLSDSRLFKGARVAPYGANMALVLYRKKDASGSGPRHLVRLLYNEQVMRLPNCTPAGQDGLDCDLDEFVSLLNEHAQPDMLDLLCGSPSADGPAVASGGRAAAGAGIYDPTQLQ